METLSIHSYEDVAYILFSELLEIECREITVFGITIKNQAESCTIANISSDRNNIDRLFASLIAHQASLLHLKDIVDDFIA